MFLAAQLVSIVSIITTTIGLFVKDKFKIMIWLTLTNISMLVTYLLLGRYLGCLLVGGATLRTFVYFLYAKFNKKPQLIFVIFFEIYFVIVSLFLWKDYCDLFMLANLCLLTYTTWQDNMSIFRIGYIVSGIFLVTYDIFVGAYVGCVSEVIILASSVGALIKYGHKNRIKDIVLHFYSTIAPAYNASVKGKDGVYYIYSPEINDEFNNFCYLQNPMELDKHFDDIKKELTGLNRKFAVYFQSVDDQNINFIVNQTKNYRLLFHDCWMKLRTGCQVRKIKCQLENVAFRAATEKDSEDLLNIFEAGFISCTGNEVYKYPQEYYDRYKEIFDKNALKEKHIHPYIAYINEKPIAVLFVYVNESNAYICQITTLKEYRRNGVASNLISYCIKDQRNKGVEDFYLVTEKYTYLETFYMKNNFEEVSQGFCLNYSTQTKRSSKKQTQ